MSPVKAVFPSIAVRLCGGSRSPVSLDRDDHDLEPGDPPREHLHDCPGLRPGKPAPPGPYLQARQVICSPLGQKRASSMRSLSAWLFSPPGCFKVGVGR